MKKKSHSTSFAHFHSFNNINLRFHTILNSKKIKQQNSSTTEKKKVLLLEPILMSYIIAMSDEIINNLSFLSCRQQLFFITLLSSFHILSFCCLTHIAYAYYETRVNSEKWRFENSFIIASLMFTWEFLFIDTKILFCCFFPASSFKVRSSLSWIMN